MPRKAGRVGALTAIRRRIDRIDQQLVRLLNQRAALALRVGALKRRHGLPVFDGRREESVLRHVLRASRGPLPRASLDVLFKTILRQHRRLESKRIA